MKECPTCRQLFADGNLCFCRYDGAQLINKAVHSDEALTIRFSTGDLKLLQKATEDTKED